MIWPKSALVFRPSTQFNENVKVQMKAIQSSLKNNKAFYIIFYSDHIQLTLFSWLTPKKDFKSKLIKNINLKFAKKWSYITYFQAHPHLIKWQINTKDFF